ncbi:YfhO family protein [Paucihalobacter sp.]|uniref:YfhO family protein n=1 Tax=Paucihalobacter sp. TaxID=2850405 RepID=UPI002FDF909C
MHISYSSLLKHVAVIAAFVIISLAYFSPVLQGKEIFQSDIMHYIGMSKQQKDFKAANNQETYWTNSAFGGMPTYQLGARYSNHYIKSLDAALRFLPRPADYLFLYFISFYIFLISLKVDFKLAALGALAFGFSTYLIIILGVGHNSKAHAIAYMPLVLSGIVLAFNKKYIYGFLLTSVAMALEISTNHPQMTYYLMLLVLVLGLTYLIKAFKEKELPHFFKTVGILSVAVVIGLVLNAAPLMATQEYVQESTRGKSDITVNPDGSDKPESTGLDKEYITEYSYGITETFNLFIPRFMGGGSYEDVGKESQTYQFFKDQGASPIQALEATKSTPTYWGAQPIVEAPAYIGAVVIFLFVLALFLLKGSVKWWLLAGTIMSLLLSYGKNLEFLTEFFINYVPLYNKFRAVSSIQVILELCVPALGILGLQQLFKTDNQKIKLKALKNTVFVTAGIALVFLLFKDALLDFVGANDGFYRQNYGNEFIDAVTDDRKSMFTSDTIRTLVLVLLSAGVLLAFVTSKIDKLKTVIGLAVLIFFDLVMVNRNYVNNDNFVSSIQVNKPYQANAADIEIMKDDGHFRVFDLSNDGRRSPAKASYFHNSLGGYHAAKLGRYNDVYNFYVLNNNINVLNMLNTKYIIIENEEGAIFPYKNEESNGNAWFVNEVQTLSNEDEVLLSLDTLNHKKIAVTSEDLGLKRNFKTDSTAVINLVEYKPNYLKYQSNNQYESLAVFSEIYYANGWKVLVDGNEQPYYRLNYLLRALPLEAGQHTIEFKFEPEVVEKGSSIMLAGAFVFGILLIGGLYYQFKRSPEKEDK